MKNAIKLAALALLLPASAQAADTVKAATSRVAACVQARDAAACRKNVTANSLPLWDRFAEYRLMDCLPQQAAYVSHQAEGSKTALVKGAITTNEQKSALRLVFSKEQAQWKLNLPESLRRGIGKDWEGKVEATEQLYLLLRSQLGENLNCTAIRNLAAGLAGGGAQKKQGG